jgi:hypothetical protein
VQRDILTAYAPVPAVESTASAGKRVTYGRSDDRVQGPEHDRRERDDDRDSEHREGIDVELARLREQVGKWRAMAEAKAATVAELEARIGAEVLATADDDAAATAGVLAGRLAKARAERDTAFATVERAEQQIEDARRQRLATVADDCARTLRRSRPTASSRSSASVTCSPSWRGLTG